MNPGFALGMFHAESESGTRGYAVITKNWANILYYHWTKQYGATRYAPGNGYTYAKFPTWRAGVRAYTALLARYWRHGYRSVSVVSARWLGTHTGSKRHLRYLTNIVEAMTILPDDARPVMTRLSVPSLESRARHGRLAGDGQPGRHRLPGQAPQAVTPVVLAAGCDGSHEGVLVGDGDLDDRRAREGRRGQLVGVAEGHRQGDVGIRVMRTGWRTARRHGTLIGCNPGSPSRS